MWTQAFKLGVPMNKLDDGDKLLLPASALESLLSQSSANSFEFGSMTNASNDSSQTPGLPSPITFEIRNVKARNVIYGGVKEFSAEEGLVHLPQWMQRSLNLETGDTIALRLKELPKGQWARLRPISADYKEIMDYRAALESYLRANYNTLTAGEILNIKYGSNRYEFLVDDLKPEKAVCVTDTDIEIDIEPLEQGTTLAHEQNPQTTSILASSQATDQPLNLGQSIDRHAATDQYVYFHLKLDSVSSDLELVLLTTQGNTDIVADTEKKPVLSFHEWSDLTSKEEKSIIIRASELQAKDTLYIGVHGADLDADSKFKLTLRPALSSNSNQMEVDTNTEDSVECENCGSWVPQRTLPLHERFCFRNNVRCPWGCGAVFKKGSEELDNHWHCDKCDYCGVVADKPKHQAYFHQERECVCGEFKCDSIIDLSKHRRTECYQKLIICRFCHNLVPQEGAPSTAHDKLLGLHGHESYCGSRTIECQKCHKQIPIKDIQVHAKVHQIERQARTLPPQCRNVNCVRPAASNSLKLCQNCFGPFWVSTNDPGNIKLIQRVARKYHSQLTSGCGRMSCKNKFCATATGETKDPTEAAQILIPLIQSLQQQLSSKPSQPILYLCVDDSTAHVRSLGEALYNMVKQRYDLNWCIKAVQTEKDDLSKAKDWVENNAPLPR
ncbi:hypothetical protein INT44_001337 [Umbelopsis vinacea]|uniref:Ubiquitin-protein ligase E3A N-terminal zinc-binding domain-containing protein n=1 Tax=Umbelopsis vinacea TaxID=44442 RepID=A0A8H7Q9P3_9FUNG|nr:hypothetical protein INT44_001337 [Umbelopsis vinacea]